MRLRSILLLAPVCLLSACALDTKRGEPPVTRVTVQPSLPSEADQLLAYFARMRKLETRELATEREQMRAALQTEKSEFSRVKLAILLTWSPLSPTSSAQTSDDAELMVLLEPLVHDQDTPGADTPTDARKAVARDDVRALATLLYGMAQDRKKLRDQWREAQSRLNALRRDDSKELEARALRARVDELERKLAALKSIDRSVNRRSELQRAEPQRVDTPK